MTSVDIIVNVPVHLRPPVTIRHELPSCTEIPVSNVIMKWLQNSDPLMPQRNYPDSMHFAFEELTTYKEIGLRSPLNPPVIVSIIC